MLRESSRRRLAAIAFTDMVGYTALAQRDEARALRLLDVHNSLLRSVLRRYRGREVKTIGDAFLVEFDSALEAVLCAIKVQAAFWERNSTAKSGDEILIRRHRPGLCLAQSRVRAQGVWDRLHRLGEDIPAL